MRVWVPIAVSLTCMCLILYVVTRESYRSSQHDPQMQIAEDSALRVSAGINPTTFAIKETVDISVSLSSWLAIYDATGTPIVSTGLIDGEMPQPPAQVFHELRSRTIDVSTGPAQAKENLASWELPSGVRQALVVVQTKDHFIVAGRSMREVDQRIWNMESAIGIGWVLTLLATFFAVWIGSRAQDFITYSRQ